MSRSSKTLSGIFSFLPILFTLILIGMVLAMIPQFMQWDHQNDEPDFYTVWNTIWPLIVAGIFAAIIKLAALIYFIVHMLNNKRVAEGGEKLVWVMVFILTGGIGYPIYWYLRIWKEEI